MNDNVAPNRHQIDFVRAVQRIGRTVTPEMQQSQMFVNLPFMLKFTVDRLHLPGMTHFVSYMRLAVLPFLSLL